MKRWISVILTCMVLFCFSTPVCAAPPKVVDDGDLLSESEEAALETQAQAISEKYGIDVVILTVWSLDGKSSEAYADDYFDYNGYGIGPEYSSVLFLLSMEYRDWAISTCGDGIDALTDYGIQQIFSRISGDLSRDDYYGAFTAYLEELDKYFEAYADGNPIDGIRDPYDGPGSYEPGTNEETRYPERNSLKQRLPKMIFIGLVAGAVIAGIVLVFMRSQMNTAKPQPGAKSYLKGGTYELQSQRDVFLYSRVSRVRRSDDSNSGGHSGGGSSVHHSSSGRSHGGGHGKF